MQSVGSLLTRSFSQACLRRTLPSSSNTPQTAITTDEELDYWEWYHAPGNRIRAWDEAHGITLERDPYTGCPCFKADLQAFRGEDKGPGALPAIFQDRTLDRFTVQFYSPGESRERGQRALDVVRRYIENYDRIVSQYSGGGLYFYSRERGSGKTYLSTILGSELSRRGHRVRWHSMVSLLQEIKAGYDRDSSVSSATVIARCRDAEVLMLDDIGVERQTGWVNETVYGILDHRLAHGMPTFFTSNRRPRDLDYDERVLDRITRMAELIEMPEESVRRKLAAKNPLGEFLGVRASKG